MLRSDDVNLGRQWSRVACAADFLLDIEAVVNKIKQQHVEHYSRSRTSLMNRDCTVLIHSSCEFIFCQQLTKLLCIDHTGVAVSLSNQAAAVVGAVASS